MFLNLAHRGASEYAPENTLAAFYKAIELGANGIETDLRVSRDGVLFLQHDERLERTTNGTGVHSDYTWSELKEFDAGSWYSPVYAGERLVALSTFLQLFGPKPVHLDLELKSAEIESCVLDMIKKFNLQHKVTITSFHFEMLREIRRLDSQIAIGYLVRTWDHEVLNQLRELQAYQICPKAETVTTESVREMKKAGYQVRPWKVKDEAMMNHCLSCGVDGMTINFPDKLHKALRGNA